MSDLEATWEALEHIIDSGFGYAHPENEARQEAIDAARAFGLTCAIRGWDAGRMSLDPNQALVDVAEIVNGRQGGNR